MCERERVREGEREKEKEKEKEKERESERERVYLPCLISTERLDNSSIRLMELEGLIAHVKSSMREALWYVYIYITATLLLLYYALIFVGLTKNLSRVKEHKEADYILLLLYCYCTTICPRTHSQKTSVA